MINSTLPPEFPTNKPLSKNAIKKQKRLETRKEARQEKKRAKQEAKKLEQEETKVLQALCDVVELPLMDTIEGASTQSRREWITDSFKKAQAQTNIRVMVDLSFEDLMSESELKSISSQVAYCYNANRYAIQPVKLDFVGIKQHSFTRKKLEEMHAYESWESGGIVTLSEGVPYQDEKLREVNNYVYLTADSENKIEALDANSVYIIGGIVDRNRHKGLTKDLAAKFGLKTARLPLDEYKIYKVLTTNHCLDLILEVLASGRNDWKQAVERVVPSRKYGEEEEERAAQQEQAADMLVCQQVHSSLTNYLFSNANHLIVLWNEYSANDLDLPVRSALCGSLVGVSFDKSQRGDCLRMKEALVKRLATPRKSYLKYVFFKLNPAMAAGNSESFIAQCNILYYDLRSTWRFVFAFGIYIRLL